MAPSPSEIKVNTSTVIGSTYAQLVGVTVSDVEGTLEFVYVNPKIKNQGEAVARVTVPMATMKQLGELIVNTVKKHEEDKSKRNK